jgi:hypothetical protein
MVVFIPPAIGCWFFSVLGLPVVFGWPRLERTGLNGTDGMELTGPVGWPRRRMMDGLADGG